VKHAAELEGRSVSDFVAAAAEEMARRTIEEAHVIRLSVDDQRRFAELLPDPPALPPAMKRAREAHAGFMRSSTDATVPDCDSVGSESERLHVW